jgi:anti-sigma B factor antagonist
VVATFRATQRRLPEGLAVHTEPATIPSPIVVTLSGELDIATVPDVHEALTSTVEANPGATVIVNLAAVTFLDSTCLSMFTRAHRRALEAGGILRVAEPAPFIRKVFEATGLTEMVLDRPPTAVDLIRRTWRD